LVIAFEDIIDIEKKSTAYFIPNAIQVSTDSAKVKKKKKKKKIVR
jgi:hypothetical protein